MDLTNAARVETMPDVGCGAPDAERLFDPELLARYRAEVRERTLAPRGTTHLNTIDAAGNVASLTVSNGEGCGHILPGTGIMLNNMLGEEDLNPHGFHRWRPDERMSSMMMPSIAELGDGRLLATGSGGSNRIRTAVLQVLVNVIDFRLDVEEAVCRPRIHFENDVLYAEGGFAEAEMAALLARHPQHKLWPGHNIFFGGAHTLMRDGARVWGVGDPRRGGVCHVLAT